jgi:hypothetical protein
MQQTEKQFNARIGKVSISNRINLDPVTPIPFENNSAAFSYLNDTRYIPFLSSNDRNFDQYGKRLLEARLTSTTHNACITTKKDYCAGNGFRHIENKDLDPNFTQWLGNMNLKNDPATEINKQAFEAFFTFGNCPIELVRFKVAGKRYFFVYVHNFLKWRLETPKNDIVTRAITSVLFTRNNPFLLEKDLENARSLPIYNPRNSERDNWQREGDGTERTMLWYKHSVSSFEHYGLPSSVSSMIYQILEYKGARYNLDNFENNMVVAALLILQGNLSQAEAQRIAKEMNATHVGDGKRGRMMAVASEEGIDKTEYHQMNTQQDGSYTEADQLWTQKIIQANQWDAILAGIVSPSTLGKGSGFLTKIKEHINNTVITPAQQDIQSKVWVHIFRLAKEWMGFNIDENEIEIANTIDISGLTDVDITAAVTRNEVRRAKGLTDDPTPLGDEYMKSTGPSMQQQGGDNVQP